MPACFSLVSEKSLEASGVKKIRNISSFNLRGQGVLLGFVDTGIDYTNPVFLKKDGTSRIISIWDQTIDSEDQFPGGGIYGEGVVYGEPTYFGTEYTMEQINQALAIKNPLEIVPSLDEIGHGTMLAGVAAGSEIEESEFSGVAPEAELVVVKLKQAKDNLKNFFSIPLNVPCYQENDIMWGLQYLTRTARQLNRPLAICVGLGSSQGNHNGKGALSTLLSVAGNFPGVCITVAGGNEGNAKRHYYGRINTDQGYQTVELNIGENEPGFSMEIWGTPPGSYSISIQSPYGEQIPIIENSLFVNREVSFMFENTIILIDYQTLEVETGAQLILLRFRNPAPGIWRFNVYGSGDLSESFHIWLPSDDFISGNTFFIESNPYTTITNPGNSIIPITVTAYNANNEMLYPNAGRGFSNTNTVKPELAAPGVNTLSPTLEQGFTSVTGTSVAAAHTAGVTALMLEWGIVKGNFPGITTVEVKKFFIRGAIRNVNLLYPNREWGYGILDIYNAFNILRT
jgi:subtilisin family serine protease